MAKANKKNVNKEIPPGKSVLKKKAGKKWIGVIPLPAGKPRWERDPDLLLAPSGHPWRF
jgi:hypothetical protein